MSAGGGAAGARPIRTLVVDDEPLARRRLVRLLAAHPDVEVVGEAGDGDAALAAALRLAPDLVLLDVEMPARRGTEALARIAEGLPEGMRPLAVFVTAHEEHAVRAFALEALDYLVKPVEAEALARALWRVRERLRGRERGGAAGAAAASPPAVPAPATAEHIVAIEGSRLLRIPLAEVGALEVEDGLTWARTPAGDRRVDQTLAELEGRLPSPPFLRVSRSAIVNLDWLESIEPGFGGGLVAALRRPLDREIAVSRRRAARLREML